MALPTAFLDSSRSAAPASPDLLDWPLQAAAVASAAWLPAHAKPVSTPFGDVCRMREIEAACIKSDKNHFELMAFGICCHRNQKHKDCVQGYCGMSC